MPSRGRCCDCRLSLLAATDAFLPMSFRMNAPSKAMRWARLVGAGHRLPVVRPSADHGQHASAGGDDVGPAPGGAGVKDDDAGHRRRRRPRPLITLPVSYLSG